MPCKSNKIISCFSDLPTSKCLLCSRQSTRNHLWLDENQKSVMFLCGKNTIYKYWREVDFDATIDTTHYLIDVENKTALLKLSAQIEIFYDFSTHKPKILLSSNNGENEAEFPFQSLNFADLPSLQLRLQKLINFL